MAIDEYERVSNELDRMKYTSLDEKEIPEVLKDLEIITTEVHFMEEEIDYRELVLLLEDNRINDFLGRLSEKIEMLKELMKKEADRANSQEDNVIYQILDKKEDVLSRIYNYYNKSN